jgi:hypothetical protein
MDRESWKRVDELLGGDGHWTELESGLSDDDLELLRVELDQVSLRRPRRSRLTCEVKRRRWARAAQPARAAA